MEVFECILNRRSIRSYSKEPLSDEALNRILEAARWAPSAVNRQPWEFIVIRDRKLLEAISAHAVYGRFISQAPLAIAVVTNPASKWHIIDGSGAIQNMALAAWEMGIGTCWIGSLEREEVKKLLGIPDHLNLLTVLPFGHPAEAGESERKPLDSMLHFDRW